MTTADSVALGGTRPPATPSRIFAAWHSTGRSDLKTHVDIYGPVPFPRRVDHGWQQRLIEDVAAAGLTGRGGAHFPTARKLETLRASRNRPLLAVNALEGEPASQKDGSLLTAAPHLVIDGAQLVALAIGAREITLCVADDRPDRARALHAALGERRAADLGPQTARVERPPGRYVTGEESALVAWLAGHPAHPQFRPYKGAPLVIGRRPVLVQSAETLAHLALIARYGPAWFRSVGAPEAPGTCLVTLSGPVAHPGVYEVEIGTPIARILENAGITEPIGAVLVGGYGGTWLRPGLLQTPYAPGALKAVGGSLGAGVLAASPASACGVAETARVATYMANESAGQCGPCVFGLHAIADDLVELARGDGDRRAAAHLVTRLSAVDGRGACGHPDGVVRMVRSALEVFAADVDAHARHRPCPGWNRPPILPVPRSAGTAVGRW